MLCFSTYFIRVESTKAQSNVAPLTGGEATVIVGEGLPPQPALPGPASVPPYPDGSNGLTQTMVASPLPVGSYRQAPHLGQLMPDGWQDLPSAAELDVGPSA